jgi:hypothetical protein
MITPSGAGDAQPGRWGRRSTVLCQRGREYALVKRHKGPLRQRPLQHLGSRRTRDHGHPNDTEWDEFLGHFERRRLALGDCGRAYGTNCIHEHSCVRCPLLRVDPAQRQRLIDIRDNLTFRIAEAEREGWLGEADGLRVSLAAAKEKLAHADASLQRRVVAVELGMPSFRDVAARTVTT